MPRLKLNDKRYASDLSRCHLTIHSAVQQCESVTCCLHLLMLTPFVGMICVFKYTYVYRLGSHHCMGQEYRAVRDSEVFCLLYTAFLMQRGSALIKLKPLQV